MSWLLVQSCSKRKVEVEDPAPALRVYDGYFFRIVRKARRDGYLDPDIIVRILSARHGLLDPEQEIRPYDQRMTTRRATKLRPQVTTQILSVARAMDVRDIAVNVGKDYLPAVIGIESPESISTWAFPRRRIGERGSILKEFLQDPSSEELVPLEMEV